MINFQQIKHLYKMLEILYYNYYLKDGEDQTNLF